MARTFRRTKARHGKNYTHPPCFHGWWFVNGYHTQQELDERFALFERQLKRHFLDVGSTYEINPVKYRKHNQADRFRRRVNRELYRYISEGREFVLPHHHRVRCDHYYYV